MLGIGGGMIMIPLLILVGKFSWYEAYILSLFSILCAAFFITHRKLQKKRIDFQWAVYLESFGSVGAVLGAMVALRFHGAYAVEILLLILTVSSVHSVYLVIQERLQRRRGPQKDVLRPVSEGITDFEEEQSGRVSFLLRFFIAIFCGMSSGFLGVGGGMMIMVFSPLMNIPMSVVTASSSYATGGITMAALLAAGAFSQDQVIPWNLVVVACGGTLLGSFFGVWLSGKTEEHVLRWLFSIFLVLGALGIWKQYLESF